MPDWKKNEQEHALGCVERLVQKKDSTAVATLLALTE